MQMQGHRCRQHDEKSNQVEKPHADVGIDLDTLQVGLGLLRRFLERLLARQPSGVREARGRRGRGDGCLVWRIKGMMVVMAGIFSIM